jgi:predicted nucleotidyltransferase
MSAVRADVRNAIIAWAERTPRVRRVWVLGSRMNGNPRDDDEIDLAIEVEPVVDSEETLAVWLAQQDKWRSQLQQQIDTAVGLEWFDPDGSTPRVHKALNEGAELIYERAEVT